MKQEVTHMALEIGKVDVWDKQDGLSVQVCHHLKHSDITTLVHQGHFGIHNWKIIIYIYKYKC